MVIKWLYARFCPNNFLYFKLPTLRHLWVHNNNRVRVDSKFFVFQILYETVRRCLRKAHEACMETIAFPALGCGFLNFPMEIVTDTIHECIEQFTTNTSESSLKEVVIVIEPKGEDWQHVKQVRQKSIHQPWNIHTRCICVLFIFSETLFNTQRSEHVDTNCNKDWYKVNAFSFPTFPACLDHDVMPNFLEVHFVGYTSHKRELTMSALNI